jgi:hypothetical protein
MIFTKGVEAITSYVEISNEEDFVQRYASIGKLGALARRKIDL